MSTGSAMICAAMFASLAMIGCATGESKMAPSNKLPDQIDALVSAAFPDANAPGCSVLVRRNGETIFAKAYGLASLDTKMPNTPETNFRLASMTKQFTAAATMRLVEKKKLRLDEALTDIFPGFPDYGKKITVRHILNHTSGLKSYEKLMPADAKDQILDAGVLEMMMHQTEGDFEPGAKYEYSNTGYAMLAMIVEKRSGMRFADFLQEQFFGPFHMDGTVAHEEGRDTVPTRAFGYVRNDDGSYKFADQSTTSAVLGDGGVYTSVTNYAKWADAWFDGRVLNDASREQAWTPATLNDASHTKYGFGWNIEEIDGVREVNHTGSTTGFNNCGRIFPPLHLCVVILSNCEGNDPKELGPKIEKLVIDSAKAAN